MGLTEIDIGLRQPISDEMLEKQAYAYERLLHIALDQECPTFIFWGVSDANSWVPAYFKGYDAGLVFDRNFHPKPAYFKLRDTLSTN